MHDLDALDLSTALLRARLAAVPGDRWEAATPCEAWTVRDVAAHVVGDAVRYRLWLEGAPDEEVVASRAVDFAGDDPVAALDRIQGALREALAAPGALDHTVAHSAGVIVGRELLELRMLEQALHAWDIAVGSGTDDTIGDELCARLLRATPTIDRLRSAGYYAAAAAPAGSLQEQLLRAAGRLRT
ncbi:TIGR03086 family metal-binding protein [Nocardioides ginsengisoli]|uniref:TIGR03086 family metal-binding protein n=1 Tax=Nocardioides ginsengisoli TaxID=363868 RepID=A0ABW3W4X3_9ACTN